MSSVQSTESVKMADLCPEDKAKIGNMVVRLAGLQKVAEQEQKAREEVQRVLEAKEIEQQRLAEELAKERENFKREVEAAREVEIITHKICILDINLISILF